MVRPTTKNTDSFYIRNVDNGFVFSINISVASYKLLSYPTKINRFLDPFLSGLGRAAEQVQKGVIPNKSRAEEIATKQFNAAKKEQSVSEQNKGKEQFLRLESVIFIIQKHFVK